MFRGTNPIGERSRFNEGAILCVRNITTLDTLLEIAEHPLTSQNLIIETTHYYVNYVITLAI